MARSAEHVVPATPAGAVDARRTSMSISADLEPPLSAWMPQTNLDLQRDSPSTLFPALCCSIEQHYPATACWDYYMIPRSTLPGKSGPLYPRQLPETLVKEGSLGQKYHDQVQVHPFDPDVLVGQPYTPVQGSPIIGLQFSQSRYEIENSCYDDSANRRSDSSTGVSVPRGFSKLPTTLSGGSVSTTHSGPPIFSNYGTLSSNRTSLVSSTHLSPAAALDLTPQSRPDQVRAQSCGRVSPSTRPSMRSTPCSTDSIRNTPKWPTWSDNVAQSRQNSPLGYRPTPESSMASPRYSMQASVSSATTPGMPHNIDSIHPIPVPMPPTSISTLDGSRNNAMMMPVHMGKSLPASHGMHYDNCHHSLPQSQTLAFRGLIESLQNNVEPQCFHCHYADLAAPLELYPALLKEPAPPPPEDMNPSDPDFVPYKQNLRFDGDIYTPEWVRGHCSKREGWCSICKPGRWLVLKNSAYWYDKLFTHGISAATGAPFQEPLYKRRRVGNPDVCEGLCGSCNKWIVLVGSKKDTTWFRHAYKCQSHANSKIARIGREIKRTTYA